MFTENILTISVNIIVSTTAILTYVVLTSQRGLITDLVMNTFPVNDVTTVLVYHC